VSAPEFSRLADIRQINAKPEHLVASETECAALAERFLLVAVKRLEATVALEKEGTTVHARGRMSAEIVQSCAVSGEDIEVSIDEPVTLRFVPATDTARPDEEIELTEEDLDEIPYAGTQFDLGEAIAQSLALAIDPYLTGPQAEEARRKAGLSNETASGPFAALAALKKQD
jgi:uncharacterized metal-binding protein YceD (DUF177 family)